MATSGNISGGGSSTDTIVNLLNLVKGTTTTTKSNISKGGMDALIQQILGSASGLGAIASGEKNAGLYGSTTKQLLTNDLVTRTAGELAKQKAGTTTTTPPKLGTTDILGLIALSAGKGLIGPTLTGLGKKYGVDKLGDTLAKTVLGGGSGGGDVLGNINDLAPSPDSAAMDLFSGTGLTDTLASFGGGLLDSIGGDVSASIGSDLAEEGGFDLISSIFG